MLLAAQNGHVDVMQSLLQHRATVDLKETVSAKINFKMLTIIVINFKFSYIPILTFEYSYFKYVDLLAFSVLQ